MKICNKCNIEKQFDCFSKDKYKKDGHHSVCKECRKLYLASHYKNPENKAQKNRNMNAHYHRNKERILKEQKQWYEKNIAKVREQRKARYWADPQKAKDEARLYSLKRRKVDPLYKLVIRCRKRTWAAFNEAGYTKRSKTFDLIGCTQLELKAHLEERFQDGMDWGNYGLWHVDHIIPLASAKSEQELLPLFHYSNLQPLWAEDNIKKGARIDYRSNSATT